MGDSDESKLKDLEKFVQSHILGMNILSQLLKSEAMRILGLKSIFTQGKGDGKILNSLGSGSQFKQYDEFKELISKDLCEKIVELEKSLKQLKRSMSILSTDIKTKKAEKVEHKIASFSSKSSHLMQEFNQIWAEGSYLICNYRLDIVAKQIARWTQGLQITFNEGDTRKQVEDLFK